MTILRVYPMVSYGANTMVWSTTKLRALVADRYLFRPSLEGVHLIRFQEATASSISTRAKTPQK